MSMLAINGWEIPVDIKSGDQTGKREKIYFEWRQTYMGTLLQCDRNF